MNHDDLESPLPAALWEALRHDEPEPHEIERAYRRFVAEPRTPRHELAFLRWFALGLLSCSGLLFAATHVVPRFRARQVVVPQPARKSAPSASAALWRQLPEVVPVASAPAASVASARRALERAPLPPEAARRWQSVALALRQHDYAAAETALMELEASSSRTESEAASLSLAQVLLARGRVDAAQAKLERLSQSASSGLVRDKSAALLAELSATQGRSPKPAAGTQ
jgi:hypothetical protein